MRPRERLLAAELDHHLRSYEREVKELPGLRSSEARRDVLIEQLLESVRRVKYIGEIGRREISERRCDPRDILFDPLRAAILKKRQGDIEEAYWLVFLLVHFGKSQRGRWAYVSRIYGRLGIGPLWNWSAVSSDPTSFRQWLAGAEEEIRFSTPRGGFGNHRKYQSLDPYSETGTGAAVESYIEWVGPPRTHRELFSAVCPGRTWNSEDRFEVLYRSMQTVASFGRTARFDYLTNVGNIGLAAIEPGIPYLQGATGPLKGARLLYGGDREARLSAKYLDQKVRNLGDHLGLGMQVFEDALCNWQKSPGIFRPFRG